MLHSFRATAFVLGALAILCCARPSIAQTDSADRWGFLFSVGWSTLHTDGKSVLDNEDGWYIDSEILYQLQPESPLWLGVGFAGSYFEADRDFDFGSGLITNELEVSADLGLFAIEPRLTYVLLPRKTGDNGLFLSGRLGAGLLIADQSQLSVIETGNVVTFSGDSDTTFAFEVRPRRPSGLQRRTLAGRGAEFSYMWAWGDFDPLNSNTLEEGRAGVFFRFTY
jgi:hypothetical protein